MQITITYSNLLTQQLHELQCLLLGGLCILHVEQYRYPNGPPNGITPPFGIESEGGGGRIGEDTGGSIPGSLSAHTHNETNATTEDMIEM